MSETRPLSNDVLRRVSAAIEARLTPELNYGTAMALLVVIADVLRELDAALAREQQPPTDEEEFKRGWRCALSEVKAANEDSNGVADLKLQLAAREAQLKAALARLAPTPARPPTMVGCEDSEGLLKIHPEAETCPVCKPPALPPSVEQKGNHNVEQLDLQHNRPVALHAGSVGADGSAGVDRTDPAPSPLKLPPSVEEARARLEVCRACDGQGESEVEHYVSRDMAIDAGEPDMEGISIQERRRCDECGGAGTCPDPDVDALITAVQQPLQAEIEKRQMQRDTFYAYWREENAKFVECALRLQTAEAELSALKAELLQAKRWYQVIDEFGVTQGQAIDVDDPDPKAALNTLITWNCQVALNPAVSKEAVALVEQGRTQALADIEHRFAAALGDNVEHYAAKIAKQALRRAVQALPPDKE